MINRSEILQTIAMIDQQHLDIRTITMGISLLDCVSEDPKRCCDKIYDKICARAEHLVKTGEDIESEFGIPIVNKRVSVTPVAQIAACCKDEDLTPIAHALGRAAETLGIDYLGGFSALVQKGIGDADRRVIQSIPQALATTSRVCSSVNVASLRAGINMDAVLMAAQTIIDAAKLTADQDSVGASKFVCFANMVEDSPFMAGAVHGGGEADAVINVGVSGPGVMAAALETLPDSASMMEVAEKIKQTAFKITRAGELMSREAAHRLGVHRHPVVRHRRNVQGVHHHHRYVRPLSRASSRSSAWAPAVAPARPARSPCSTMPSRRAASWPVPAWAVSRALSFPCPRMPA